MAKEVIRTYCAQCHSLCAMRCIVENGVFVRAATDHDHPAGGSLCPK